MKLLHLFLLLIYSLLLQPLFADGNNPQLLLKSNSIEIDVLNCTSDEIVSFLKKAKEEYSVKTINHLGSDIVTYESINIIITHYPDAKLIGTFEIKGNKYSFNGIKIGNSMSEVKSLLKDNKEYPIDNFQFKTLKGIKMEQIFNCKLNGSDFIFVADYILQDNHVTKIWFGMGIR